MKILGWDITREQKLGQFETVLQRLVAAQGGSYGNMVTPENCMQSPTVHAIVTAISNRISISPVHVYQKGTKSGRDTKEKLPDHPVAKLLKAPNQWQTTDEYLADAASQFVRYGNFYAYLSRGTTGPIPELLPLHPCDVTVEQDRNTWAVRYKKGAQEIPHERVHHVRGPARNFLMGDSPVNDINTAIALEILAEKFGASFFKNGATPFLFFNFLNGMKFKDKQDQDQFLADFQTAFGGENRFRAGVMPAGMDKPTQIQIENDKAQFLQTREYQRTVIAGAFGVPPHLAGALSPAFNVEQKDGDFTLQVVLPIAKKFEAAMERDLLTVEDRRGGVIIRFNLDSDLRADFKSRVEGYRVLHDSGVLSANEIREREGLNPITDEDGGEDYLRPANFLVTSDPLPEAPTPAAQPTEPKVVVYSNVTTPDVRVENKVAPHMHHYEGEHKVTVEGSTYTAGNVHVDAPVDVEVKHPTILVDAPIVTVEPGTVTINNPPANVTVTNEVIPADVHVDPPKVQIDNYVTSPEVNVEAPSVLVKPEIKVEAPAVTIKNELPEYEVTESEPKFGKNGRIEKMVTTKRLRKK